MSDEWDPSRISVKRITGARVYNSETGTTIATLDFGGNTCTGCGGDHRICRGVHPELSTGTDWPVVLLYASLVLVAMAVVSALVAIFAA